MGPDAGTSASQFFSSLLRSSSALTTSSFASIRTAMTEVGDLHVGERRWERLPTALEARPRVGSMPSGGAPHPVSSPLALDSGLLSQAVPGPAGLWALQVDGVVLT